MAREKTVKKIKIFFITGIKKVFTLIKKSTQIKSYVFEKVHIVNSSSKLSIKTVRHILFVIKLYRFWYLKDKHECLVVCEVLQCG